MELYEILDKDCCSVAMTARTKDTALHELAGLAVRNPDIAPFGVDVIYQALKDREDQGSTGFGDGVALPHMRLEGLSRFLVLIAASKAGIEFDAIDRKRVHLFFLIIGPAEKVNEHVQILASISRASGPPISRRSCLLRRPAVCSTRPSCAVSRRVWTPLRPSVR